MTFARFVSIGLTLLTLVTFSSQSLTYENNSPTIPLRTKDKTIINVNRDIAEMSAYLKPLIQMTEEFRQNTIEDFGQDMGHEVIDLEATALAVYLPIKEASLLKLFQWCEHHYNDPVVEADHHSQTETPKNITPWDREFMEHVDFSMLYDINRAARFLGFNKLTNIGDDMISDRLRGKSLQEFKDMFDF